MSDKSQELRKPSGYTAAATDQLSDDELEKRRQQRLRQAMDDSSLLIAYACESKRNMAPENITKLIALQAAYAQKKPLAETQEADFWNTYSALSAAIIPATVEGIKRGIANKDISFWGWIKKFPWIAYPATVALVLYIALQIYVVQGAETLKQYRQTTQEMSQAVDSAATAAKTVGSAEAVPAGAATTPDSFQSDSKTELLAAQAVRYQALLAEWNKCPVISIVYACPVKSPRGDEEAIRAEITLGYLKASILPLILGLLGACTQVLRSIAKRVIDQSMNTIFLPAYYVRLVLGMILGATIGLFLQPSSANGENPFSFLSNLPLLTASFLAGYAVEIVFALLDKIVGDARSYISGNKADAGPATPAKQ